MYSRWRSCSLDLWPGDTRGIHRFPPPPSISRRAKRTVSDSSKLSNHHGRVDFTLRHVSDLIRPLDLQLPQLIFSHPCYFPLIFVSRIVAGEAPVAPHDQLTADPAPKEGGSPVTLRMGSRVPRNIPIVESIGHPCRSTRSPCFLRSCLEYVEGWNVSDRIPLNPSTKTDQDLITFKDVPHSGHADLG